MALPYVHVLALHARSVIIALFTSPLLLLKLLLLLLFFFLFLPLCGLEPDLQFSCEPSGLLPQTT